MSAAAAAPMVCRSPPAEKARPAPSITSTLTSWIGLDFGGELLEPLRDRRSIELKATGRLSVMVATAPSIRSNAGIL